MCDEVDFIVNHRQGKNGLEYLVKWKDYPAEDVSWEPVGNLLGSADEALSIYYDALRMVSSLLWLRKLLMNNPMPNPKPNLKPTSKTKPKPKPNPNHKPKPKHTPKTNPNCTGRRPNRHKGSYVEEHFGRLSYSKTG